MDDLATQPADLPWSDIDGLYRRHAPAARRLAYAVTGDAALAEDITQEAFIRVAGRLHAVRRSDAFAAYLRTTVLRLCSSERLSRSRSQQRDLVHAGPFAADVHHDAPSVPLERHIRDALMSLPARQRTAMVLSALYDLDDQAIAQELGCRPGTVRSLLSRARTSLKASIER